MSKESNIPDGPNPFEGAAEDPTQVFASPAAPDSTQSFPTAPDATQPFPTTPDATQSFPTAPDATQSFPAAPAEEPHVFGAPVPPNEQPAWSQTDQPTPAPNPYTSQGYPVAVAPKERTLSNGVAFAAVGAMAGS